MKKIILIMFLLSLNSQAQKKDFALPPLDRRAEEIAHGDLFSVKITPRGKTTTFFIVGKKAAQIDLGEKRLRLQLPRGQIQELRMVAPGQFIYDHPITESMKIIVTDPLGTPEEVLQLDTKP